MPVFRVTWRLLVDAHGVLDTVATNAPQAWRVVVRQWEFIHQ